MKYHLPPIAHRRWGIYNEVQRADFMLRKSPVSALFLFENEYVVKNCSVENTTENWKHLQHTKCSFNKNFIKHNNWPHNKAL